MGSAGPPTAPGAPGRLGHVDPAGAAGGDYWTDAFDSPTPSPTPQPVTVVDPGIPFANCRTGRLLLSAWATDNAENEETTATRHVHHRQTAPDTTIDDQPRPDGSDSARSSSAPRAPRNVRVPAGQLGRRGLQGLFQPRSTPVWPMVSTPSRSGPRTGPATSTHSPGLVHLDHRRLPEPPDDQVLGQASPGVSDRDGRRDHRYLRERRDHRATGNNTINGLGGTTSSAPGPGTTPSSPGTGRTRSSPERGTTRQVQGWQRQGQHGSGDDNVKSGGGNDKIKGGAGDERSRAAAATTRSAAEPATTVLRRRRDQQGGEVRVIRVGATKRGRHPAPPLPLAALLGEELSQQRRALLGQHP